jgi:hypothetical protein
VGRGSSTTGIRTKRIVDTCVEPLGEGGGDGDPRQPSQPIDRVIDLRNDTPDDSA